MGNDVLILAAGKSTRTAPYLQKAAVKIFYNGKVAPLVCHQIEMLRAYFSGKIYVMVGWQKELVMEAVKVAGQNKIVEFVCQDAIVGVGEAWREFVEKIGNMQSPFFVSVNVDDLHKPEDYIKLLCYAKKGGCGISGCFLSAEEVPKGKTCYRVSSGRIKDIVSSHVEDCEVGMTKVFVGSAKVFVGSGMYVLNKNLVEKTVGNDVDEVISEMLKMTPFYPIKVSGWTDCGTYEVLHRLHSLAVGRGPCELVKER